LELICSARKCSKLLLWAHHEDDPCLYTYHYETKQFAEKSRSPLVTVRGGGPWRRREAFTVHGFVGIESDAVVGEDRCDAARCRAVDDSNLNGVCP
jgi:hypothetical protein